MTRTPWALAGVAGALSLVIVGAALAAPRAAVRRTNARASVPQTGLALDDPHAYALAPGPWQVTTHDLTLHDNERNKDLPIRVYVPTPASGERRRGDKLPLVVFSHGSGGGRQAAPRLLGHWASYGYIVIAPSHADSINLQRAEGKRNVKPGVNHQGRIDRVADLSLVIDQLPEVERQVPALAGRIDKARIAVAGHSAGALSAMQIGGVIQNNSLPDQRDPRVKCVIVLSGAGPSDKMEFSPQAWDNFTLPALVVTGSLDDAGSTDQTPHSRRQAYERGPATGDKYLLYITGATHMSFAGQPAGSDTDPRGLQYDQQAIFQQMQSATQAFLDAYEKDDPAAKAYLQSNKLKHLGTGVVWEHK